MKINNHSTPPPAQAPANLNAELQALEKLMTASNQAADERTKLLHHALDVLMAIVSRLDTQGAR